MSDIFEQGSRLKVRFEHKGIISQDDLWDLSLEALDGLYKRLKATARNTSEEGLLTTRTIEDKLIDLKMELVKHVFEVKSAENEARKLVAENRQKKEYLKSVLADKQNEAVKAMSPEEIQKMIDNLG